MSTQTPDQDPENEKPEESQAAAEETAEEQATENAAEESEAGGSLEEALEAAQLEAQNAKDDLLRVQAEMQNLRRRTEQDIEKAHKFGQEKFSIELLAVMDNLERSLEAASNSEDETIKAIREGVDLTLKGFSDCFSKFNIEVVDPLGEPFDPQLHQAMSIQENAEAEPNSVIAVMQKGYTLHGRVIRPAMVMVSK
ncbi:MAG: protein GrpE [Pseudohongiella sp.]|nr:MAG: protein GrpE [Pseudohongiella sp.]